MSILIGLATNIIAQVIILRYLFVYYMHGGDKTKFEQNKITYIVLFIFIGVVIYSIIANTTPIIAIAFVLGLVYFAIVLYIKWRDNVKLPDPFIRITKNKPDNVMSKPEALQGPDELGNKEIEHDKLDS